MMQTPLRGFSTHSTCLVMPRERTRHCERSEAIQGNKRGACGPGCFVATLLAMTTFTTRQPSFEANWQAVLTIVWLLHSRQFEGLPWARRSQQGAQRTTAGGGLRSSVRI